MVFPQHPWRRDFHDLPKLLLAEARGRGLQFELSPQVQVWSLRRPAFVVLVHVPVHNVVAHRIPDEVVLAWVHGAFRNPTKHLRRHVPQPAQTLPETGACSGDGLCPHNPQLLDVLDNR